MSLSSAQISSLLNLKGVPISQDYLEWIFLGDLSYHNLSVLELWGKIKILEVKVNLDLSNNYITSLKGLPKTIRGNLYLSENKITSLKGLPKTIGGNLNLGDNPGKFTEEQVRSICNVKGNIYV